jgi:Fanconi anemia group M protein
MIKTIASREQIDNKKEFGIRLEKKPLTTKKQQEFIIESLPGVGPSLAKGLLKKFKTIKKIMNSSEKELKEIEKLGQKKAKNIQEILDEIYED